MLICRNSFVNELKPGKHVLKFCDAPVVLLLQLYKYALYTKKRERKYSTYFVKFRPRDFEKRKKNKEDFEAIWQ